MYYKKFTVLSSYNQIYLLYHLSNRRKWFQNPIVALKQNPTKNFEKKKAKFYESQITWWWGGFKRT